MTEPFSQPSLSRTEVEHVALLARLTLSEREAETLRGQLGSILAHVAILREVDTSAIPTDVSVHRLTARLRNDEVMGGLPIEAVLSNAPAHEDGHFRVPAVLDEQ